MKLYAHSLKEHSVEDWQTLEEHAQNVATLAAKFAEPFGSPETARLLGLVHDIGKARASFQSYLKAKNGIDDGESDNGEHGHSGAGACWLANHGPRGWGTFLAYCAAGHHAGLPDWIGGTTPNGALGKRLADEAAVLDECPVSALIAEHTQKWNAIKCGASWKFACNDVSFWIRMMYSCLTDADFLDTEAFMNPDENASRGAYPKLEDLATRFFTHLDAKQASAKVSELNRLRAEIRNACEKAAVGNKGLFNLTVPTGGGKTLSSTAFAFRHALGHGLKRIIYVIPYTSIIEQTSEQLREFLGDDGVLEHHCNLEPEKETRQSRLASENWDAPVIVTTSVQFFESLYACKSRRCRKLHNIAKSVIILDEVQLLPPSLLLPITEAIAQLTLHYGCSIVLSTATQPFLTIVNGKATALKDIPVTEIIPRGFDLYRKLKRTEIQFPDATGKMRSWNEIACELTAHKQVLCIVNTRRHCRELFELMPEGTLHLSASMCGAHRSSVIREIKRRLNNHEPVRVISTQLVEAGVDIDFPVVYRAMTGLASVVQAAGRCNREEALDGLGRVVVFNPPEKSPKGDLRWAEDTLVEMLHGDKTLDVDNAEIYPKYYQLFFSRQHDCGSVFSDYLVRDARYGQIQFREAAEKFQMIDSQNSVPVIVRYGADPKSYDENAKLIESLRAVGPKREIMRKLQRYVVTISRSAFSGLVQNGGVEEVSEGIFAQSAKSLYSETYGLDFTWSGFSNEEFII